MENKGRVIVIDMVGDGDEPTGRLVEETSHECRCGVCTCEKTDHGAQPETMLLPAQTDPSPAAPFPPLPGRPSLYPELDAFSRIVRKK